MSTLPLLVGRPAAERSSPAPAWPSKCRAGSRHKGRKGSTRCTVCCATDPGRDSGAGDSASADRIDSGAEASAMPDSLPVAGVDTDWREFRARLVAGSQKKATPPADSTDEAGPNGQAETSHWAHTIPRPEQGCLLIAHPLMFVQQQTYFNQAVIFIFEHDEHGSSGLILNRSTNLKLGKVSGAEAMCPEFADSELFLGGDVGTATVHMLHGTPSLPGSKQVVQGVHLGGFEAARSAVKDGHLDCANFRWFARYSGWAPGQLQRECEDGVWFCAAAGPSLVLQPGADAKGSALWHATLELMGGQFADLSTALKTTYTGYRPDVMGHGKKQDAGAPEQSSQPTDAHHSPDEQKEQP